jgi:hypothetical protein
MVLLGRVYTIVTTINAILAHMVLAGELDDIVHLVADAAHLAFTGEDHVFAARIRDDHVLAGVRRVTAPACARRLPLRLPLSLP